MAFQSIQLLLLQQTARAHQTTQPKSQTMTTITSTTAAASHIMDKAFSLF